MTGLEIFLFGKLPTHGDFVSRGLSPSARDTWDAWCVATLVEGRERLKAAFDQSIVSTPPWCFLLPPTRPGERWQAGCATPSTDRTGRPFLFVLGVASDAAIGPDEGARIAAVMTRQIYQAFKEDLDLDIFVASTADALAATGTAGTGGAATGEAIAMTSWRTGWLAPGIVLEGI